MNIYKESKEVPVAVGQVWRERGCEDNLTVIGLKGDEFAGEYTSGDHGFTASHTCKLVDLIKHESGAEMDFERYEYCQGTTMDQWYAGPNGWMDCEDLQMIGRLTLCRRAKETTYEVTVDWDTIEPTLVSGLGPKCKSLKPPRVDWESVFTYAGNKMVTSIPEGAFGLEPKRKSYFVRAEVSK